VCSRQVRATACLTGLGSHSSTRCKTGKGLWETNTAHKRIQITIETARVMKIRRGASTRLACPKCGCEVDVVDLIQPEVVTGIAQQSGGIFDSSKFNFLRRKNK
jgi:hypothetical protein